MENLKHNHMTEMLYLINVHNPNSNADPIGQNVLNNILALANTNINNATFDFDITRPVEFTTNPAGTTITASFDTKYGEQLLNGNNVRVNIFDNTNKVIGSTTGTAYGFVGAYIALADGSSPSKTRTITQHLATQAAM